MPPKSRMGRPEVYRSKPSKSEILAGGKVTAVLSSFVKDYLAGVSARSTIALTSLSNITGKFRGPIPYSSRGIVGNGMKILVVTGDQALRSMVVSTLESKRYLAHSATDILRANECLRQARWDAVLVDAATNQLPDHAPAMELVQRIGSHRVWLLADPDEGSWQECAELLNIRRVLPRSELAEGLHQLITWCAESARESERAESERHGDSPTMYMESLDEERFFLAASPAMLELHKNIRKLGTVEHPVLILGESGVGKEIVARLLHKYQAAPDQKFINVNTAAIPSELLESELFGYEAGAFTGAVKPKPGKFELANKGTLLLDEIGEMSPQMQAKLLHVLQDGMVTRLGGRFSQRVEVRILAATNINIENAIAEKRFREDLYYRISTFTLTVPALRDRREEIPLLIEQMAVRAAVSAGQEPPTFSARLIEATQEYHWPGNLRELRNFVTRLLVLQDEDSAYKQLRALSQGRTAAPRSALAACQSAVPSVPPTGMKGVVSDLKHQVESTMIREALLACGWNRRRAALNLNISYRALLYKIQQHGLSAFSGLDR